MSGSSTVFPEYNICILDVANQKWLEMGTVSMNGITIHSMVTPSLYELHQKLCEQIHMYETSQLYAWKKDYISGDRLVSNIDDDLIIFVFIGCIRYRKGTVYYGIQYSRSTNKTRILAYGTNRIHHSGVSFGTNPLVLIDIVIKDLKECVDNILSNINKNSSIYQLFLPNEALIILQNGTYTLGI